LHARYWALEVITSLAAGGKMRWTSAAVGATKCSQSIYLSLLFSFSSLSVLFEEGNGPGKNSQRKTRIMATAGDQLDFFGSSFFLNKRSEGNENCNKSPEFEKETKNENGIGLRVNIS
jgi:hypothetical protein